MQPSVLSRIGSVLAHTQPIAALLFVFLLVAPTAYAAVYKCAAKDGSTAYSDQPCDSNAQAIQVTPDPLHTTPKATTQTAAPGNGQLTQAREQMVSLCARANYDAWYHTQNPKPTPEQTSAKLREALQTCRAEGRAIVPQTLATQVPTPTQTPSAPLTPAMIAAVQDKSARETKASVCSMKAFNEWIKTQGHPLPDPNVRIAKMVEISNQCRRPLGLSDMIPPAPIVAPNPILQAHAARPPTVLSPAPATVPPYLYSQQAHANPPAAHSFRTVKPPPSQSLFLAIAAFVVTAVFGILAWLGRSNSRYQIAMRWIVDKLLRLGVLATALTSIPAVFIVGIMANDAGSPAGLTASKTILLVGGSLALLLLWASFGYSPSRDTDTGKLKGRSVVPMTLLYLVGATGWIFSGSWLLARAFY